MLAAESAPASSCSPDFVNCPVPLDDNSAFSSYHRDSGAEIAWLLQALLEQHGFRAILDVDELDAGHFDVGCSRRSSSATRS